MEWTAFACGISLSAAFAAGFEWIDKKKRWDAFFFWFQLSLAALNGLLWSMA